MGAQNNSVGILSVHPPRYASRQAVLVSYESALNPLVLAPHASVSEPCHCLQLKHQRGGESAHHQPTGASLHSARALALPHAFCHGGPYLNTTIHTTTKSYIIFFLYSYMILLGFYWKLWLVRCIVFIMVVWVGGMGW
jgi:hypothetical protein